MNNGADIEKKRIDIAFSPNLDILAFVGRSLPVSPTANFVQEYRDHYQIFSHYCRSEYMTKILANRFSHLFLFIGEKFCHHIWSCSNSHVTSFERFLC